jgi:hypothetical protein
VLAFGPADRPIKGGWPAARVGQIEASFPYHIHDADATDKRSKNQRQSIYNLSSHPIIDSMVMVK